MAGNGSGQPHRTAGELRHLQAPRLAIRTPDYSHSLSASLPVPYALQFRHQKRNRPAKQQHAVDTFDCADQPPWGS